MSVLLPPGAPPASGNAIGAPAGSEWTSGALLSRAVIILIGIAVGCVFGFVIGLFTGWIEIVC